MTNFITYSKSIPVALDTRTGKLVRPKDMPSGFNSFCICPGCKESLTVINKDNIQRDHFRHKLECKFPRESIIHLVAKEILKSQSQIVLPELSINYVLHQRQLQENLTEKILNNLGKKEELNLVPLIKILIFKVLKTTPLQPTTRIQFENVQVEGYRKTALGPAEIDIIGTINEKEIFIEPFLTNKIDSKKLAKIKELNVSTISIDLRRFVVLNGWDYDLNNLTEYIISNTESKSWTNIEREFLQKKIDKYCEKILQDISDFLIQKAALLNQLFEKQKRNLELKDELVKLRKQIPFLEKEAIKGEVEIEFAENDLLKLFERGM